MKYLLVLKEGDKNIESSEGASITETASFILVRSKKSKVEFLVPINSLLYVEAIFSDKEKECLEEQKEECPDEDERVRAMFKKYSEQDGEAIDIALKKFFNL